MMRTLGTDWMQHMNGFGEEKRGGAAAGPSQI
jgi:hypothetical protein